MDDSLENKYDKLLADYKKIVDDYKTLQDDYSENTIVQSMNDMKNMYDIQKKKIDNLSEIIDNITDMNKCIKVMLAVLHKNATNYNYASRYELKNRLEFIQDILDNSLKLRSRIYYLEYE